MARPVLVLKLATPARSCFGQQNNRFKFVYFITYYTSSLWQDLSSIPAAEVSHTIQADYEQGVV
jgi:hypothetical protein